MCTKFILTENLWAGRSLIGAENSHLRFTNVLKIRDTEYLRSGLVSSRQSPKELFQTECCDCLSGTKQLLNFCFFQASQCDRFIEILHNKSALNVEVESKSSLVKL